MPSERVAGADGALGCVCGVHAAFLGMHSCTGLHAPALRTTSQRRLAPLLHLPHGACVPGCPPAHARSPARSTAASRQFTWTCTPLTCCLLPLLRRMEAKLRTMEQRLQLDGSAVAVGAADMVAQVGGQTWRAGGVLTQRRVASTAMACSGCQCMQGARAAGATTESALQTRAPFPPPNCRVQALEALPPGTAAAAVVEEGDSTTFRFKEGMPSAADYSKTVETINGTHAAK